MLETRHSIRCADGQRLTAEQTGPQSGWNGGVIIIAGALAVPTGFYRGLAGFLACRGYRVIRFAYRGMSPDERESGRPVSVRLRDWGRQDIEAMIQWARQHHEPERLLLLGHSIGGQLLGLAPSAHRLDGIALITSPSGYWGHYSHPHKLKVWLMWHLLVPAITRLTSWFPMHRFGLGDEDIPASIATEWARWGRHRDYLFDPAHGLDISSYARIELPLLAYYTDDDWLAPPAAVEALLAQYRNARIRRFCLRAQDYDCPQLGHFRLFSRGMEGSFWVELVNRLDEM